MRLNDSHDPRHGPRGAALAREMRGEAFDLEEAEMELLGFACEEHTNSGVSSDPTVGVCWDADRLNLWRGGGKTGPRVPFAGGGGGGGGGKRGGPPPPGG